MTRRRSLSASEEAVIRRDLLSTARRHSRDGVALLVSATPVQIDPLTPYPIYARSAYRPDNQPDPYEQIITRITTWFEVHFPISRGRHA